MTGAAAAHNFKLMIEAVAVISFRQMIGQIHRANFK
jgi:hypothetical protein